MGVFTERESDFYGINQMTKEASKAPTLISCLLPKSSTHRAVASSSLFYRYILIFCDDIALLI